MEATNESTTSVFVVSDEGDILSPTELLLSKGGVAGAASGETEIQKASRLLATDVLGGRWVEPRINQDSLLAFLDWNS